MMDGSSSGPAPFLLKTYEMVDDHFTNAVVSWSQNGYSFVVWDPPEFARVLLPNYFKHNNFSSFIRQLNTYGFRKIDPVQWEFANEEFIRGKTHLLKNIHRRKPTHSHSAVVPLITDSERQEFQRKIEMMRQENLSLQSSLDRQRLEGLGYGDELRSLGLVLQNIEFRHGRMMTTLSQLLPKPGDDQHPLVVMEPLESHAKKRRLLASQISHDQGSLHVPSSSSSSFPMVDMGQVEKLDSAITSLEKLFQEIEVAGTEVQHNFTMWRLRSTISTEMSASSGDSDLHITPPRHCMSASSSPRDSLASPEVVASSSTYAECLAMSPIHINPCVEAGTNDVFWQQFLSEAPDSTKN